MSKKRVFLRRGGIRILPMFVGAGFVWVGIFGLWWFQSRHVPSNYSGMWHGIDVLLFGLLTLVVWYQMVSEMLTWEVALFMKKPKHTAPPGGLKVALCTTFVPGKEPYDLLETTLKKMAAVAYPHVTWLLDEGDDPCAKKLCKRYGVLHYTRWGKSEYNTEDGAYKKKTKAGNYNAWFTVHGAAYDIVAQHDVDFMPRQMYLHRILGYFKDPDIAFVGTPQLYGNEEDSWIAKGAAEQAYGFYGPTQKGLFGHDMQLFIGANHAIRVAAHNDITGYSGHIVEDHLTGMRIYANRWKSVYVPEALLIGEGPATWDAYFSQQMRWAFGLMDILFRHSPKLIPRMRAHHGLHYFLLQHYYFYGMVQAIGLLLLSLYFFFGMQSTSMEGYTWLLFYSVFLILQIVIFLWLQRYYIRPQHESGFHLRGKLLNVAVWPVYMVAFFGALVGKKLPYRVTPKGSAQAMDTPPALSLFIPHLLLGPISFVGSMVGYVKGNAAPQLMFWAMLNTVCMYGFVLLAAYTTVKHTIQKRNKKHLTETVLHYKEEAP